MYIGEKMSIAIEILAIEFSKNMFKKNDFKKIFNERKLVYQGDEEAIERVINTYGNNSKGCEKNGE